MPKLNASEGKIIQLARKHRDILVIIAVIIYFAIRLVYFATHIHPYFPPDEVTHLGQSVAYSKVLFIPANGPETYEFGLVSHRPFLFYWLMGRVVNLNVFSMNDLIFLRLANGLLGVFTAVYVFTWIRLVTTNKLVHFLTVVIFTNILMMTGLCASVNYDNLTNLLAAMSIYYLTLLFERRNASAIALFFICLFAGCLTKEAFLPLALILFAVLLIHERKSLYQWPGQFLGSLRPVRVERLVLYSLALIMLAGNCILYGGSLLRYRRLLPPTDEIIGVDNAMQNRIFARGYIVSQFKNGNYTYEFALNETNKIKNPGDRSMCITMLQKARNPERIKQSLMNRARYTTQWMHGMLDRTVGYAGHQLLMKETPDIYPYYIVLLVSGVVLVRKLHWKFEKGHVFRTFVIAVSYILVLMWYVNYPIYVKSGLLGLAFTGRYLFPVFMPICGLIAFHIIYFFGRKIQIAATIAVSAVFIYGDFIFFLRTVPDYWLIK